MFHLWRGKSRLTVAFVPLKLCNRLPSRHNWITFNRTIELRSVPVGCFPILKNCQCFETFAKVEHAKNNVLFVVCFVVLLFY